MLSIQDLIQKAYRAEAKIITVKIERMEGEIELRVPTPEEIKELREKHKNNYNDAFQELIFTSCINPKLNDDKLLNHFNCKETPYKVVTEIFGEKGVDNLVNLILDESSKPFDVKRVERVVQRVKN